jgi:tetratricopeptide (TPR) repeat protein
MRFLRRRQPAARFATCIFATLLLSGLVGYGQGPSTQTRPPAPPIPPSQHSVDVVEHLSPEEVEDWKLNDRYESVAQLQRQACTPDVIQRYQTEIVPTAENKFQDAEACFRKILQYVAVWPGTDDSAYPINFRQIATAQMGQQHWTEAEQSLLKSISIFDAQMSAWEKNDTEFALHYRGSQSRSHALLAVVYFREGRVQDALTTVEKAYDEVTNYKLAANYRNEILSIGKAIAGASGDSVAQKVWSQRQP